MANEKCLFIQDRIVSIKKATKNKPAMITIALPNDSWHKEDVNDLVDRLIKQSSFFSEIVLNQLSLTWGYNEKALEKEITQQNKAG